MTPTRYLTGPRQAAWAFLMRMRAAVLPVGKADAVLAASSAQGLTLVARAGESLSVRSDAASRFVCVRGSLWITQEEEPDDVTLVQGQSASFRPSSTTLVQALSDSDVWMGMERNQ
ncbi:MAG: DUF2917 domain-containing protein [Nocardioidaceae bacterium]